MLRSKGQQILQKSVSVTIQRACSNKNKVGLELVNHPFAHPKKSNLYKKNLLVNTQLKKDRKVVPPFLGAQKKIKTGRKLKTSGEVIHT